VKRNFKIIITLAVLTGCYGFAMEEHFAAKPKEESNVAANSADKGWWSSIKGRFNKKVDSSPKEQTKQTVVPVSKVNLPEDASKLNHSDVATAPDLSHVAKNADRDSHAPESEKQDSHDADSIVDEFNQSLRGGSAPAPESSPRPKASGNSRLDQEKDAVHESNYNYNLMSKTKNSLFDEFKILKSDNGIKTFQKLSKQDISNRVGKSVDDISVRVGLNKEQEVLLQRIIEDNLLKIQVGLRNRLIAQTPEDVARAIFSGSEHDDRWAQFDFNDKQQRDKFEDYVMNRANTMENRSLLQDYLHICSNMAQEAESAASDARDIGDYSKDSAINKLKVGMYRTKAGLYMAANPCILAVFVLGIVGEFLF